MFRLKIKLERQNLDKTIPADLAHALWKLQVAYYRMVAQILHGSPTAKLSPEEKQKYLLVFKIEEGSTEAIASLFTGLEEIASYVLNNMEPWEIIILALIGAGVYLGRITINEISENKKRNTELEKERIKSQMEDKRQEREKEKFEEMKKGYEKLMQQAFENQEKLSNIINRVLVPISEAGKEGRLAILKDVSGLEKANFSGLEFDSRRISEIRRRNPISKLRNKISQENIIIEKIDVSDRNRIRATVKVKDTEKVFTSDISLTTDDENLFDRSMDIIWNSVRYPNNFFWAQISFLTSDTKLISSTILSVSKEEKDLPHDDQEDEDLFPIEE